jgi:DNA primase
VLHDEFRRALEAIKLRAPIEDVVRERVPALKKAGALWVACCPFHDERTPSFKVDPRRGTWRCFGACGVGGDVIAFVEKCDNVTFLESVEILAARCGVDLPKKSGAQRERDGQLDPLRSALEFACRFYRGEIATPEGRASARYLADRGLSEATAEAFAIGHAPASGQALVSALRAANVPLEAAERAGLVRRTDQGRPYDFFRGRLVIPIRDLHGAVVGFGARRLDDRDESGPKYINTAETDVFHKGRLVYALDRALPEVRKCGHVVLVEGYTDVMAAHQCGVGNVVAVLGTSTTEDHAALLRRTGARRISLVFDGDDAGRKAAWRALQGLLHLEIEIDVVGLTGGVDPCDLCLRDGAQVGQRAFTAELEMARSWFPFVCEGLNGLRGNDLAREVDRVLELLGRLAKPVHREARLLELAEHVRMSPESLRAQAASHHGARRPRVGIPDGGSRPRVGIAGAETTETAGGESAAPAPVSPTSLREQRELRLSFEEMVGALLVDPALSPVVEPWLDHCPEPELVRIADAVLSLREEGAEVIDENTVMTRLIEDPARARVVALAEHVRAADEDWTPVRFVELQLERVRQIVDQRARREGYVRLRERESSLLDGAGAEAAAHDPDVLALARSLTRNPSTPQRTDVHGTSRAEAGWAP